MPPDDVLDEFASTWKEWHYLVGGFALGVVVGTWVALRLLLATNGQGAPHRTPDRPNRTPDRPNRTPDRPER